MKTRNKTCCFTGHRSLSPKAWETLPMQLEQTLGSLIQSGVKFFGAGGARGFDTLAAQTVIKLRETYPQIKLALVLPCQNQTHGWSREEIYQYSWVMSQADKVVYTSQEYFPGCMHKRNRYLVDNSGVCVCYLSHTGGGTAYTVDYAKKQGLLVLNLAKK